MSPLAPVLQGFFTDKLIAQRQASPNTVAAYRDTCRLLLAFASKQTRKQPCQLDLADLDAPLITSFLTHLEAGRANTVTTRNARLAAIRSLFRYAALRAPRARRADQPGPGHPALSAATGPSCATWTQGRSTRCWPHPARPAGSPAATTPCCWSPCKPGCASPSSPA